jgi:hypothetical protein
MDSRFRGNDVTFDGAQRRIAAVVLQVNDARTIKGLFAALRMTGIVKPGREVSHEIRGAAF